MRESRQSAGRATGSEILVEVAVEVIATVLDCEMRRRARRRRWRETFLQALSQNSLSGKQRAAARSAALLSVPARAQSHVGITLVVARACESLWIMNGNCISNYRQQITKEGALRDLVFWGS